MSFETLERLVDTWLFYSYPNSTFAFQGGEPTLAGLDFFERLVRLQQQHGPTDKRSAIRSRRMPC